MPIKLNHARANALYANIALAVSPGELLIIQTADRSLDGIILQIALCLGALLFLGMLFHRAQQDALAGFNALSLVDMGVYLLRPLIVLYALSLTVFSILRPLFGQRQVLRFTPAALEIESFDFGRRWKHQEIPSQAVTGIAYGLWTHGKSHEMGLRISTNTGQIDLLEGLKAVEAQTILDEVSRLGYRVLFDEDLPGMILMEQKRRKFIEKIYG